MLIIYSEDPNFKTIELNLDFNIFKYAEQHIPYININNIILPSLLCNYSIEYDLRWADIGKPEIEDIIGKNPGWAYQYALNILKCRWADIGKPEVEDIIGKNPGWACPYAINVLKCRWAIIGKYDIENNIINDKLEYKYKKFFHILDWTDYLHCKTT